MILLLKYFRRIKKIASQIEKLFLCEIIDLIKENPEKQKNNIETNRRELGTHPKYEFFILPLF